MLRERGGKGGGKGGTEKQKGEEQREQKWGHFNATLFHDVTLYHSPSYQLPAITTTASHLQSPVSDPVLIPPDNLRQALKGQRLGLATDDQDSRDNRNAGRGCAQSTMKENRGEEKNWNAVFAIP